MTSLGRLKKKRRKDTMGRQQINDSALGDDIVSRGELGAEM